MWCFSLGTDVAHVLSLQRQELTVRIYNRLGHSTHSDVMVHTKTLRDLVNMPGSDSVGQGWGPKSLHF